MSTNLWGKYIIKKQTKLCPSSGESKRKITVNSKDCAKCKKVLKTLYKKLRAQEYILDSANQKRKRQDKEIRRAWAYSFQMKGMLIDLLRTYEPTLLMIVDKYGRAKNNPTWTKRAQKIYEITQASKQTQKIVGE